MTTKIAIVILNWQKPQLTLKTVNSLLKINHPNFTYQIFLVDNGSQDDSWSQFRAAFSRQPKIKLIRSLQNLMFAAGNNLGIRRALTSHPHYLLLLNNDVLVDPDFLKHLLNYLLKNPTCALVGPKIYFAPGYEFRHHYRPQDQGKVIWAYGGQIDWQNVYATNLYVDQVDTGQFTQVQPDVDFVSGCCQLIRASIFKHFLLDPDYCMYLEDVDFCQKVKKLGFRLAVIPQAKIWHFNAASSQAGGGPLHDYFLTRNRLLFGFKYASFRTKLALFRQSFKLLFFSPSVWQKRGVIDFYLHRLGKGSWR